MVPQPEQQARNTIDDLHAQAGWSVCDPSKVNIHASRSVATRRSLLMEANHEIAVAGGVEVNHDVHRAQNITYRTIGAKPKDLINKFLTGPMPCIAVTVDMFATGTDIKAMEVVMFMYAIKSRAFFEQMKGRGVRIMKPDGLQSVTPDAKAKDHFVIVDAVGVCEQDKTDSRPMEQGI